jgi:hypothetical protein
MQVFNVLGKLTIQLNIMFQPASSLQNRLSFFLITPEIRLGYFPLEFENFRALVVRIKDTLAPAVFFPRWRSLFPEALQAFSPPKSSLYKCG